MKQSVIRALAANKSKEAIDKLILIAKNDSDPTVRQYAVRSLIGIDENLYMQVMPGRTGISNFKEMEHFEMDEQTKEKIKQKVFETQPEIYMEVAPAAATATTPPSRKSSTTPAPATTHAPKVR